MGVEVSFTFFCLILSVGNVFILFLHNFNRYHVELYPVVYDIKNAHNRNDCGLQKVEVKFL